MYKSMSFLHCILFLVVLILINCSANDIEPATTIQYVTDKIPDEFRKTQKEFENDENQLKIDRELLEREKQLPEPIEYTDVLQLNVGGEIITTTRLTLTKIHKSTLSILFNGRWEYKLKRDQNGYIFLNFHPTVFRHLLNQLQIIETKHLYPPSQPSLIEPFKKMLRRLGLNHLLSSEKKNVVTFNIGGQMMTNRRSTFTQVSNSTFDNIASPSKTIKFNNETDVFLDYDPKLFQHLIKQLRKESFKSITSFGLSSNEEKISFETMLNDLTQTISSPPISTNTKWKQNGMTIAGGNEQGNQLNQLYYPEGIYVDDDDQCIYIADWANHRIVEWKSAAKVGQVVAGGNGVGGRMDQLNQPRDVVVDKKTDSLIICDYGNRRVVRWSRQNGTNGQTIISDIDCWGIIIDGNGDIYVSDTKKHEVRRWKIEEQKGIIVAGGNSQGNQLNQLNGPTYFFVDEDDSIYVSDYNNHRVMKWVKGAREGVVIAGRQGQGTSLTQLYYPQGVLVDHLDNVYVADSSNHRIMCWSKGSTEGRIIVGGNGQGHRLHQLDYPRDLSFDRQGHLYVVDWGNDRVQKYVIDLN